MDLNGCGHENLSDWEDNDTHFENLIKGLAQSEDMKKNLENICVKNCELPKEEPIKTLKKYEFKRAVQFNTPKIFKPKINIQNVKSYKIDTTIQGTGASSTRSDDPKECIIF